MLYVIVVNIIIVILYSIQAFHAGTDCTYVSCCKVLSFFFIPCWRILRTQFEKFPNSQFIKVHIPPFMGLFRFFFKFSIILLSLLSYVLIIQLFNVNFFLSLLFYFFCSVQALFLTLCSRVTSDRSGRCARSDKVNQEYTPYIISTNSPTYILCVFVFRPPAEALRVYS